MIAGKHGRWGWLARLFLFIVELYTILVLLNVTFLVPFPYDYWRVSYVIIAALISLAVACWLQWLRLRAMGEAVSVGSIALSAPLIIWISAMVIAIPTAMYSCYMHFTHGWM